MSLEDLDERIVLASVTEIIQAPANEIWPFLSAIGAERILIPGCTRSAVLEGYGEGAIRRVYFGETFFDERIIVCDHASYKLKYQVLQPNPSPAKGVLAAVQLHDIGGKETKVTWVSGAKELPPKHETSTNEQAVEFCQGQIASLRKLSQATTSSF